ncbi:hypothetical protein Aperf_G00000083853 [Anoplocephala perfoliata]
MRRLTTLVSLLLFMFCVLAFVEPAKVQKVKGDSEESNPIFQYAPHPRNIRIIIEALDKMSPEEIQKKIDNFPKLDLYIKHFDREPLSAVIVRVPNLDYNLLKLRISTLSFIYRMVDGRTRQYLLSRAPRAMEKLNEFMSYGRIDNEEKEGKGYDDKKGPKGKRPPKEPNEMKPKPHQYGPFWYEGEKPRGFNETKPKPHQDNHARKEEPSSNHSCEHSPEFKDPPHPPLDDEEPSVDEYPYGDERRQHEVQPPRGFYEERPEWHQNRFQWQENPYWHYPYQPSPDWNVPRRPCYDIPEQYPDEYLYEEQPPPHGFYEMWPEWHQNRPRWQENPCWQYQCRPSPVWNTPPRPPFGGAEHFSEEYSCADDQYPNEKWQQNDFDEMKPEWSQNRCYWQEESCCQYPCEHLPYWNVPHRPPTDVTEETPDEYPYAYDQCIYEEQPPCDFNEMGSKYYQEWFQHQETPCSQCQC